MPLESIEGPTDTIDALVRTNPEASDPKSEGDNHIRGVKNTILNTWPNVNGPITRTQDEINNIFIIGELRASSVDYTSNPVPMGWLVADGSAVSRTTYADYFALVGTTYGAGDGSTTFNLPNATGRALIGADPTGILLTAPLALGGEVGADQHTLTVAEMPAHTHAYLNRSAGAATQTGSGAPHTDVSTQTSSAGGNSPHNNLQPSLGVSYLVRVLP